MGTHDLHAKRLLLYLSHSLKAHDFRAKRLSMRKDFHFISILYEGRGGNFLRMKSCIPLINLSLFSCLELYDFPHLKQEIRGFYHYNKQALKIKH